MARKNIIYCEVTCRHCGRLAINSGYYSPERIKRLKKETKDWISTEDYPVLCPECQEELEIKK